MVGGVKELAEQLGDLVKVLGVVETFLAMGGCTF